MYQTLRNCLLAILVVVVPVAGGIGINYASGNVHRVDSSFYRSGQLTPTQLDHLIRTAGIRSILNLRGDHPNEAWWRDETLVAASNGVAHHSIALSSRQAPDLATMDEIAAYVRDAPKPILVHCLAGADRSGLVAALYELTAAGADPKVADRQLSIRFGHFPWLGSRTHTMDDAFDAFVASRYRSGPVDVGTSEFKEARS